VACVPSVAYYFLPSVIRDYTERFPRIRVRIIDETANTVLNSVVTGRADFGISFFGTQEPDVDFKAVLREDFVLAVRRDHPLAGRRSVSWEALSQERFMTVAKESGNRLLIDDALAKSGKRTVSAFEVSHVMTLLGLVEAGLGVAAVPQLAMPLAGHATLTSVKLEHPRVTRTLGLIARRGRPLAPAAQQLYNLIHQAGKTAKRKTPSAEPISKS
jgi:DNA-binding transcriptional LysR family regulator